MKRIALIFTTLAIFAIVGCGYREKEVVISYRCYFVFPRGGAPVAETLKTIPYDEKNAPFWNYLASIDKLGEEIDQLCESPLDSTPK